MEIKMIFLMSVLGITTYQVLLKVLGVLKIDNFLVLLIVYLISFLITLISFFYTKTSISIFQNYNINVLGIIILLGGATILIEFSYLEAFKHNVNISTYGMSVMTTSIILMLFIGKMFFNENISFIQIIGAIFIIIGLLMIKLKV